MTALLASPAAVHPPAIFGVDPIGALLSAVGRVFTSGAQTVAGWAFDRMTAALLATTRVQLDGWFAAPWRAMVAVAAVLALPILLAGVATEVAAGRPAAALRRGVLAPLLVAPALLASRALLALVLALVDGACALVVRLGIGGTGGYGTALNHLRSVFGIADGPPLAGNGIVSVLILLVAALLAFVVWIELALRAAMIYLLAAFIPLALAGLFWSETARWTRRLLEVVAAVVLAQLVITVVMVLAAAALAGHADGLATDVDNIAVGLALLFLGTLGLPMTFRLIPHVVEASVAAGGGAMVAQRMRGGGGQLLSAVPHPAAQATGAALAGRYGAAAAALRQQRPAPDGSVAKAPATASAHPAPNGGAPDGRAGR